MTLSSAKLLCLIISALVAILTQPFIFIIIYSGLLVINGRDLLQYFEFVQVIAQFSIIIIVYASFFVLSIFMPLFLIFLRYNLNSFKIVAISGLLIGILAYLPLVAYGRFDVKGLVMLATHGIFGAITFLYVWQKMVVSN